MKKCTKITRALAFLLLAAMLLPTLASTAVGVDTTSSALLSAASDALSEELPQIYLTTDDGKTVDTKTYKDGKLSMTVPESMTGYDNDYVGDTPGKIEIRCRGNSTFSTGPTMLGDGKKFSYKIKLDKKADMLGMGKSKHWVLIANFYDVTNMRNKITYDLSGRMGMTYTQSRWVEVHLNGEYRGIYTLCESIRIAGGRVEIPDWEDRAEDVAKAISKAEGLEKKAQSALVDAMTTDLAWITSGYYKDYKISDYYDTSDWNINSGYLIEYDERMDADTTKFRTSKGKPIQLDNPEALDTNPEMYNFVVTLLNDFEEAIYSENFCTSDGRHYSELCDVDSLIDYFLIFNLFKNIEFGWLSIFLYIYDGKIYFGPCWDFDGGSGNQVTLKEEWYSPESWFYMGGRADWWKELCGDPDYVARTADRWFEIRPLVEEMMDSLPLYHDYIKAATARDTRKFGMPVNWYMSYKRCSDFESEYKTLVDWLERRITWLDGQFALRDPNIEGKGFACSDRLHATLCYSDGNPLEPDLLSVGQYSADLAVKTSNKDALTLELSTEHTSHRYVELYVNGKKIGGRTALTDSSPATLAIPLSALDMTEGALNTVYLICINHENRYYRGTYLTLRARSGENPTDGQCVYRIQGQAPQVVSRGGSITLPAASAKEDGYTQVGWSNGSGKIYSAGSSYMVLSNTYLSYAWERNELFPDHTERKISPEPTQPEVTTTTTKQTTTTKLVTTTKPQTTTTKPAITTTKPQTSLTTVPTTTTPVTTEPQITTSEPTVTTQTPPPTTTTTSPSTTSPTPTTTPQTTPQTPTTIVPNATTSTPTDETPKEGRNTTLIVVIVAASLIVMAGAITTLTFIIKKKHNKH